MEKRQLPSCRGGQLVAVLLMATSLWLTPGPSPAQDVVEPSDAVSRQVTIYNDADSAAGARDAVSRQLTVYNQGENDSGSVDAVSRLVTAYNDFDDVRGVHDAVGREVTVLNAEPEPPPSDSVSREVTTYNRYLIDFRTKADGEPVTILGSEGLGVSAVFDDCIYVESPLRYVGIKVTGGTAAKDDRVNVSGVMATDENGERYIAADSITTVGSLPIGTFGANARSAHCGGSEWQPETGAGQRGVTDGAGACLIGLYLRLAGRLADSGSGELLIDDGSGKTLTVELPAGAGVSAGELVVADGVLSMKRSGDVYQPVFRATQVLPLR